MSRIYQGGVFILPANVEPQDGSAWEPTAVITTEVRDQALTEYDKLTGDAIIFKRKFFPISKKGINRLFEKSDNKGRIMLQVENIADPSNLFIDWLPYNKSLVDLSKYDYFIMDAYLWNGENPNTVPNGIEMGIGQIIVAAIGKKGDNYVAFINNAICDLKSGEDVGAGDPPGSGIQIPITN